MENIQGASKEFGVARHGFLIKSMTKQKLTYPWKPLLGVWVGFLALEGLCIFVRTWVFTEISKKPLRDIEFLFKWMTKQKLTYPCMLLIDALGESGLKEIDSRK